MSLLSLIFLASTALLANSAMVLEQERVCFSRKDQGLAWPLPNIRNPGILMSHVAHCFKVALNPVSSGAGTGEHLHHEHCVQMVKKTLDFIETNGYKVDSWICNALSTAYDWNQKLWDGGVWGNWEQDRELIASDRSIGTDQQQDKDKITADKRDKRGAKIMVTRAENANKTNEDQNSAYTNLASNNFGKYLIASISDPNSLSKAEKKYVRVWEDDQAITLGAVGLYCYVKGDLSAARGALDL